MIYNTGTVKPQTCYIEHYVKEFLATGRHVPMDAMMFSDKQWNEIRGRLRMRGISLQEYNERGHKMFRLTDIKQSAEQRAQMHAQIKVMYPHLDNETINGLVNIPLMSLLRSNVARILQYSFCPYDVSKDQFIDAHNQVNLDLRSNLKQQVLPNWTFISATNYDFYSDAYAISGNVNLCPELIRDLNILVRRDNGVFIKGYKIPSIKVFDKISQLHSPLVVYTTKRDIQTETELCVAMNKHVRANNGVIGVPLARGIFITPDMRNSELWFPESEKIFRILMHGKVR